MQTTNAHYMPGELVEGAVYLDVKETVQVSHVSLRLKGYEKVQWEETKQGAAAGPQAGGSHKELITENHRARNNLFEPIDVVLHQFGSEVSGGQYEIPFSFQLPSRLPGSFSVKGERYSAKVKYTLIAELVLMGGGGANPWKHKSALVVREILPANYHESVISQQSLCTLCIPRGQCKLDCSFQRDNYLPGEEVNVVCRADNRHCKAVIQNFTIRFSQTLILRTLEGRETRFNRLLATQIYDGLEAGSHNLDHPKLLNLMLTPVQENMLTQASTQPKTSLPCNVYGRLVDCRYTMEVFPVFEASCACFSTIPVASLPLHIHAPVLPQRINMMPSEFRPQALDKLHFLLSAGSAPREDQPPVLEPNLESSLNKNINPSIVQVDVEGKPIHVNLTGSALEPAPPPAEPVPITAPRPAGVDDSSAQPGIPAQPLPSPPPPSQPETGQPGEVGQSTNP